MNDQNLVTALDDDFHAPGDDPWQTETCWFSFNVPERAMAGWMYAWIRPNMKNSGGGVFVYDASGVSPWELPYFQYQHCQPLEEERDLRDFTFAQNYSVKMIEPLKRYELRYQDREHIRLDLQFDAIMDPHPFPVGDPPFVSSSHFDQAGRVTGEMMLRGERIAIDCIGVRDRSWGPRLDHRGSRLGYSFGTVSEREGFCVFVLPSKLDADGLEMIYHGYLLRDGRRTRIVSGSRSVQRDPSTNHITAMQIRALDEEGRELVAYGTALSRMMMSVPRGTTLNTFLSWSIDGVSQHGHGEDQDVWRYDQWRNAMDALRK